MSRNTWIIFSAICLLILGGLVWLSQGNRLDVSDVNVNIAQAAEERNGNIADHTIGNPDAKVVIIEYGDFQCPGCGSAAPTLSQIANKYQDDVLFIFRNFPLSTIHPNARAAAAAAEAAGLQDKYWPMHDKLFATQNEWSNLSGMQRTDMFEVYARELGLDSEKLATDLGLDTIAAKINFDTALGKSLGVTGTPAIFVNGEESDVKNDEGQAAWSNPTDFENLVVLPALKAAGVDINKD